MFQQLWKPRHDTQQQLVQRMIRGSVLCLYHCPHCGHTQAADGCPSRCTQCGKAGMRFATQPERERYLLQALERVAA